MKETGMRDLLTQSQQRGIFDDVPSPPGILPPLLPYLLPEWTIWETAPGPGDLAKHLRNEGYDVIANKYPFPDFGAMPEYDAIVTNPPFSKKFEFLKYSDATGKPWAVLLPITVLGVGKCQPYLADAEIIFFPKRIDFTGGGAPWFAVAWFTKGLGIGRQMTFSK